MKKIRFWAVIIIPILFAGCFSPDETTQTYKPVSESYTSQITETFDETLVSEEIGNLSIYIGDYDSLPSFALPLFRQKYPNIKVEVTNPLSGNWTTEEKRNVLVSIMSGKGPDLLCSRQFYGSLDYDSIIARGVAADMSEYYDADAELNQALNKKIMDSGVVDGKRYFFPLGYHLPLLLTSQKALDNFGLKPENCKDIFSFLKETEKLLDKGVLIVSNPNDYEYIPDKSGTKFVDAVNKTVNADLPELEPAFKWLKKALAPFPQSNDLGYNNTDDLRKLLDGEMVFLTDWITGTANYDLYSIYCKEMNTIGEIPVIFPIRNTTGGLTAQVNNSAFVRANSPNKDSAYKFIQIMLSDEIQSSEYIRIPGDMSVSDKAMKDYYLKTKEWNEAARETTNSEDIYMTDEQYEAYAAWINEVDEVSYYFYDYSVYRQMRKYIRGEETNEKTFEEFISEVKEEFEFRLSE